MIVDGVKYEDTGLPQLFQTTPKRLERVIDERQAIAE